MAHRKHFAVEKLSAEAQTIVHRGLGEKWTYARIRAGVRAATNESISDGALSRYASRWQAQNDSLRESQEQAKAIIAEIKASNITAGETAEALITQALFETRGELMEADPLKLAAEQRKREELQLQREATALKREQLAFDREKFMAQQEKLKTVAATAAKALPGADGSQPQITPQQAIEEIFGVANAG